MNLKSVGLSYHIIHSLCRVRNISLSLLLTSTSSKDEVVKILADYSIINRRSAGAAIKIHFLNVGIFCCKPIRFLSLTTFEEEAVLKVNSVYFNLASAQR